MVIPIIVYLFSIVTQDGITNTLDLSGSGLVTIAYSHTVDGSNLIVAVDEIGDRKDIYY